MPTIDENSTAPFKAGFAIAFFGTKPYNSWVYVRLNFQSRLAIQGGICFGR